MDIPEPDRDAEIEYPDSGSEWDGMDDGWLHIFLFGMHLIYPPHRLFAEPRISAAISNGYEGFISAWGSEPDVCQHSISRIPLPDAASGYRIARLHPTRAEELLDWQDDVEDSGLSRQRSPSPTVSEAAVSTASIYGRAMRAGSEIPEVITVVQNGRAAYGSLLTTVVEQGPAEELA
jgi:hypothetical protein